MLDELKPAARWGIRRFHRVTTRFRLFPSFLIIGTQPAAAVPLFRALLRHPDAVGPTRHHENFAWSRELHFFDHSYWRGVDWYRSCFPAAPLRTLARVRGRDVVPGEVTASYLFHPAVPERAAAAIPDARLIALLRDPVERAYWSYDSMRLRGLETLSFEEAIAAEPERTAADDVKRAGQKGVTSHAYRPQAYVARGMYAEQLERWLAYFPRERFLVLRAEDFVANPRDVYGRVRDFLGLRSWEPRRLQVPQWRPAPLDPPLRSALEERFAESNARLRALFGPELAWDQVPEASVPRP